MQYFANLPRIKYTDWNGNSVLMTNIISRVNIIRELLTDPMIFYEYVIQEGDTPEIIADKYYGSPEQYWVVLLANEIIDPQWDWPLSKSNLDLYINEKYGSHANAVSEIHHYEKIINTTDSLSGETTEEVIIIGSEEYANTIIQTNVYTLPSGYTVTEDINKAEVSSYQYEVDENEKKQVIKVINVSYVPLIERQFIDLYKLYNE